MTSGEAASVFVRSIRLVRLRPPVCILEGIRLLPLRLQCNLRVEVNCTVRASETIRGLPIIGQGSNSGEAPNVDSAGGCGGAVIMIDIADETVGSRGRGSGKALLGVKILVGMPEETLQFEQASIK